MEDKVFTYIEMQLIAKQLGLNASGTYNAVEQVEKDKNAAAVLAACGRL